MDYEVIKSDKVYEGKILTVYKDEITMPEGKTATREVVVLLCLLIKTEILSL